MADMRTRPLSGPVRPVIPEATLKNPLGTDGATVLGNNGMAAAQMPGLGTQANSATRLGAQPSFADLLQRNTTSAEPDRPAPGVSQRSAAAEPKHRPSKPALETPRESARTGRNPAENNSRADGAERSRAQDRKTDETKEAEKRRQRERSPETLTADTLASGAQTALPFPALASHSDRNAEPQPTGSPQGTPVGGAGPMTNSPEGDNFASQAAPSARLTDPGPALNPTDQLASRPGEPKLAFEPEEGGSTTSLADAPQRAAALSAGGQPYLLSKDLQKALGLTTTTPAGGFQVSAGKMMEDGVLDPSDSFPRPPHDPLLFSRTASALPNASDPTLVLNTPSSRLDGTWLNDRSTWSDAVTVQPRPGANDIIDQMNQVQTVSLGAAQRFEELARGFDKVDLELLSAVPETFSDSPAEPGPGSTAWGAFEGASAGAPRSKIAGGSSMAAAWDSRADLETRMQAVFSRLQDAPPEADGTEGPNDLQALATSVAPWERARLDSPLSARFQSGLPSSAGSFAGTSAGTTLQNTAAGSLYTAQETASHGSAADPSTARQADLTTFSLTPGTSASTGSASTFVQTHSGAWSSAAAPAPDARQVLPQNTGLSPGQAAASSAGLAAGLRGGTVTGRLDTPTDTLLAASSAGQGTAKGRRLTHENRAEAFADQNWAAAPSPLEGTFGTDMGRAAGLPGSSPQARASSESTAMHQQVGQSALKLADQLAAQGTGTARLSIQDAATGPVDIVVNLDRKSGLTIEIQAESDETRQRIENQIDSIRENLESQNFRTVEVRLNGEGTSDKHNSNQSQQHNSQQSASSQQQQNQNGSFAGDGRGNNRERADGDRLQSQNANTNPANDANPRSNSLRTQYASQSMNEKGRINVRA